MKRKFLMICVVAFLGVSFSACGSSDSSSSAIPTQTAISISTYCVQDPTIQAVSTYLELEAGDTIVRDENSTVIDTYSDSTGTLRVCLVSGSAHIIR